MTQPRRSGWAGTTIEQRRSDRRVRLLEAGLELAGTEGSAAVTVREVCRRTRLTDRYFYENFTDRDALLVEVFDSVVAQAGAALVEAVAGSGPEPAERARAATEAFIDFVTTDARKGRVLLVEPLSNPVLGLRGVALSGVFVDLVRGQLGPGVSAPGAQLTAHASIGALAGLFTRWLDGTLDVGRAALADYCVQLIVALAGLAGAVVSDPPASR